MRWLKFGSAAVVCVFLAAGSVGPAAAAPQSAAPGEAVSADQVVIQRYCVTCHNDRLETGGLSLQGVDIADVAAHREVWEKVVRKMRAGAMPPRPRPRPDDATYARVLASIETALDAAVRGHARSRAHGDVSVA